MFVFEGRHGAFWHVFILFFACSNCSFPWRAAAGGRAGGRFGCVCDCACDCASEIKLCVRAIARRRIVSAPSASLSLQARGMHCAPQGTFRTRSFVRSATYTPPPLLPHAPGTNLPPNCNASVPSLPFFSGLARVASFLVDSDCARLLLSGPALTAYLRDRK